MSSNGYSEESWGQWCMGNLGICCIAGVGTVFAGAMVLAFMCSEDDECSNYNGSGTNEEPINPMPFFNGTLNATADALGEAVYGAVNATAEAVTPFLRGGS